MTLQGVLEVGGMLHTILSCDDHMLTFFARMQSKVTVTFICSNFPVFFAALSTTLDKLEKKSEH